MFCNTGHNTYRNQGFKNRKFWLIDLFVQWKQLANCLKTVRTIRASVVVYILVKHWKTIVLKKTVTVQIMDWVSLMKIMLSSELALVAILVVFPQEVIQAILLTFMD